MLLIFDLDGTLIDSAQDLAIAMNATRSYAGLPPLDPDLIYSYVGNGAAKLVRRALGDDTSEDKLAHALEFFLGFYRQHALEHTRFYPGVREMLQSLNAAGHIMAVLTNKPARISSDILRALGTSEFFLQVYGGDSLPAKKPDPIGVTRLLEDARCDRRHAAMIGDSGVDIQTARNAGILACGVSWGFQPESMRLARPDVIFHSPKELINCKFHAYQPDAAGDSHLSHL